MIIASQPAKTAKQSRRMKTKPKEEKQKENHSRSYHALTI